MNYDWSVVIGRFQPFHNAHLGLVQRALELGKNVLILIGCERSARNIKNPWTFLERQKMVFDALPPGYDALNRVRIAPVKDYLYNDEIWLAGVQAAVRGHIDHNETVALVGNVKDGSSYYLRLFPQWATELTEGHADVNATDIRAIYLDRFSFASSAVKARVPENVYGFLCDWSKTNEYEALAEEWDYVQAYRKDTQKGPFPVQFITADVIVLCNGHVAVVRRGQRPGRGNFALPGGFVDITETIEHAARRELAEECGLVVDQRPIDQRVFDHPGRSTRGRTITHGFLFRVRAENLPLLVAQDDAVEALWLPLADIFVKENEFYEDHVHIINYFANRF